MTLTRIRPHAAALTLATLLGVAFAACGGGDGAGEATPTRSDPNSPEFTLPNFSSVIVEDEFDVDLRQAAAFDADLRVGEAIFELLDIRVSESVLTIGLTEEPPPGVEGGDLREVTITMPSLDALDVTGGSTVDASGFREPGAVRISVTESSALTGDIVSGSALSLEVSDSSSVALEGVAVDMALTASGGSTVSVRGTTTTLSLRGSGGSAFELAELAATTASVSLDGGSEATVQASERIDPVELAGASRLRYLGGAELGEVTTAGGSTVEEAEEEPGAP